MGLTVPRLLIFQQLSITYFYWIETISSFKTGQSERIKLMAIISGNMSTYKVQRRKQQKVCQQIPDVNQMVFRDAIHAWSKPMVDPITMI